MICIMWTLDRLKSHANQNGSHMTLQPVPTQVELLAALQLQYDWGVDEVLSDIPWNPLEPEIRLQRREVSPAAPVLSAKHSVIAPTSDLSSAVDLAALIEASETLEGVALSRTATHRLAPVFVEGAPFLLIGETPDADEDRSGLLFQGRAGDLLDKMLGSIGFARSEISMAPAVPWRPPGGRSVTDLELRACVPLLHRTIALCRPEIIITMGATPARMLMGEQTMLSRIRGRWAEVSIPGLANRVHVLPLNHPLQLAASPTMRRNAWSDLLVLVEKLDDSKRVRI